MCILTLFKQKDKIIFTFNRDEQLARPSESPKWINSSVFCPLDSLKGGTWIGYNKNSLICLQNGGIENHVRLPQYSISRGIMLLNLLKNQDFDIQKALINQQVEPFTISQLNLISNELMVYVYNGMELTLKKISFNNGYVNCSSTLYNSVAKHEISKYFLEKSKQEFDENDVLKWHKKMMIGTDFNQFTNKVNTVSICQFVISFNSSKCMYFDVKENQLTTSEL